MVEEINEQDITGQLTVSGNEKEELNEQGNYGSYKPRNEYTPQQIDKIDAFGLTDTIPIVDKQQDYEQVQQNDRQVFIYTRINVIDSTELKEQICNKQPQPKNYGE